MSISDRSSGVVSCHVVFGPTILLSLLLLSRWLVLMTTDAGKCPQHFLCSAASVTHKYHYHVRSSDNVIYHITYYGMNGGIQVWWAWWYWPMAYFLIYIHTFIGSFPGLHRWAGTRKVKPIWILLKQETVSGSGISWAICKSAPRSRQLGQHPTTQFFTGRMPFLPPNQQRQSTVGISWFPPDLFKQINVELPAGLL